MTEKNQIISFNSRHETKMNHHNKSHHNADEPFCLQKRHINRKKKGSVWRSEFYTTPILNDL
jgi:hypothetical protein